ncbi:MAG: aldehyde dehydrogenase family protein [Chlamydiia bacterium]|nr:aldehyde dehydrogenase family protein [Chlamydiia bacterium]
MKGQANLWTPGIKVGVRPGNFTFDNELFGPVLSIVRAQNLEDALHIVNGTRYGLTSGLQSLDRREQELWRGQIQAGNCYINRGITGAIVQRQPFGGTKDSAFGHGYKAGGPNYLLQLMHASSSAELSERCELQGVLRELSQKSDSDVAAALESYAYWWQEYFSMPHDPSKLIGQDNELVYRPRRQETAGACVRVRLNEGDRCEDAVLLLGAALLCGAELKLSVPVSMQEAVSALGMAAVVVESDAQFVDGMASGKGYRFVSCPSEDVLQAMADKGCQVLVVPVQRHGRLELPNFLQEVAFSTDYHRYGNLGDREHEERRPLD